VAGRRATPRPRAGRTWTRFYELRAQDEAFAQAWEQAVELGTQRLEDEATRRATLLPEFQRFNAELLGISVDGVWSHLAFAKDRNLHFPLLADFEPKGEVARSYQVYRASDGTSERALYVIDADGIIRWSYVSPVGVNPGADGILRALESLETEVAS
jgi:peroxiredoxin